MADISRFVLPKQAIYDSNGVPAAGAKVYFFESGTTTPLTTYSNSALTVANAHPVVADSAGRWGDIFLAVDIYAVRVDDANDNNIFTADPVTISSSSTAGGGLEISSGSFRATYKVNNQLGTSYTIDTDDRSKLISFSNASAISVTLPQANSSTFPDGWFAVVHNRGAGALTITPTTSTIDDNSSLVLATNQGALIASNGTNYFTFRDDNLQSNDAGELTISSGAITVTGNFHTVDTESDAASDDLDTINGGRDGSLLIIGPDNDARTVVVKHNTGNILLKDNQDLALENDEELIFLFYNSTLTKWIELGRSKALGKIVQQQSTVTSTSVSSSTAIPYDDTKPQNTEGDEIMTVSITPKSASNILIIEASGWSDSTGGGALGALFQDSTADALSTWILSSIGAASTWTASYRMTAGTTSSTTFKFRFGPEATAAYFLRIASGDRFSTAKQGRLTVTEILA